MEERNPGNSNEFLAEKIKRRPVNRRRVILKLVEVAALAVLFGVLSSVTMVTVAPFLEEKLFPKTVNEVSFEEESTTYEDESITYTSEEIAPEDMLLEDVQQPEIIIETVDSEVQLQNFAALLQEKADACKKWMVRVSGVISQTSWLESTTTRSDVAMGAVIADNGMEILILVERKGIASADRILVRFPDGSDKEAFIKGEDIGSGLMVVAVSKEGMTEETLQSFQIAEMVSSNNSSLAGSMVLAVGSPNGILGSASYGVITSMGQEINTWDINYKLLMTDIYGSASPEGFLVNMNGQILGILNNDYNISDVKNLITAIGISELKSVIELMSNQDSIPYFGITARDVSKYAHTQNAIPYGAYVTSVKLESPAMKAGIQAGDVIVELDGKDVVSMSGFSSYLQKTKAGKTVKVVIMRQSQGEYKESELEITLNSR